MSYVQRVTAKGRTYFYFRPPSDMARCRKVSLGRNEAQARARAATIIRKWRSGETSRLERRDTRRREDVIDDLMQALKAARARAAGKKQRCTIDGAFMLAMLEAQDYRCALHPDRVRNR